MRPARSRRWSVGDRFYFNRWSEAWPEPLVFTVTAITPQYVYFWNQRWDTGPLGLRSRKIRRVDLYRDIARRLLVRLDTQEGRTE